MKNRIDILKFLEERKTLKDQLWFIVENFKKSYISMLKSKKYHQFNFIERINEATPKLSSNKYTMITKIYWVLNDIDDFPLCENDGKQLVGINVKSIESGYGKILACCKECANKIRYSRIVDSNIKKHGSRNPFSFCKDQIARSHIEKYGNACPANNKEIRDQIKKDNVQKYGVECYSSSDECKKKVEATCMKKYGTKSVLTTDKVIEAKVKKSLQIWGTENQNSSPEYQKKKKENLIHKYGSNYRQIIWGGRGNQCSSRRAYSYMLSSAVVEPLFTEDEYLKMREDGIDQFLFRCKKCGKTFTSGWDNGHSHACPHCCYNGGTSSEEKEVCDFIESLVGQDDVVRNSRQIIAPLELDVYLKRRKIAFEFDGLYWHSDDAKSDFRYHLNKTEMCESQGVQLVHIFESEWVYSKEIVMSRIKNLLGIYDKTVFARKCQIREVSSKESIAFQDDNHIQGAVNAKVNLGLFFEDRLIALMTFGKPRFSKKYEWELLRFCNKLGYHVPGAAGKLLKHFERNYHPTSLVSYADRRWSQGKLYGALGFQLDHVSLPDYWYFKYPSMALQSRVKFQKHKLKDILQNFDERKTEVQNMKDNGYYRIFDCGNLVFVKRYNYSLSE